MSRRVLGTWILIAAGVACLPGMYSVQALPEDAKTIYSVEGTLVSDPMLRVSEPSERPPLQGPIQTIDLWCCGDAPMDWFLNELFLWATAFDTDAIDEAYAVTETRWFADGGEEERYWIAADDGSGLPDPTTAVFIGGQVVPPSDPMWQSFDARRAGLQVEPGQVYWFIREALSSGFQMTWRSTTNPAPAVVDPGAISMDLEGPWGKWVTGKGWQMEYEVLGLPAIVFADGFESGDATQWSACVPSCLTELD